MTADLKGRISPAKALQGKINVGAFGSSGGALQEKSVIPSDVEQVITPDEDYYGLSSVTVAAVEVLPVAEDVYFGSGEAAESYKIQGASLEDIADAIQEKKETTAIFTPAQMAEEIRTIVTGDNLLDAEDNYFGTPPVAYEYGLPDITEQTTNAKVASGEYGYAFTPNTDFAVYGFRVFGNYYAKASLWNGDTQQIMTSITTPGQANVWTEYILDSPVNVFTGKEYSVTIQSGSGRYMIFLWGTYEINSKITRNRYCYTSTKGAYPDKSNSVTNPLATVDIIIGPPLTESVTVDYKIESYTLTAIADEVMRITGATETMTPAEMITALQGLAAQAT